MTEWLSYGLNDLLMFTPEVYCRLYERYNTWIWPAQWLAVAAGIGMAVAGRDAGRKASRAMAVLLGVAWLVIAWAFFVRYYAEIFLAAPYFGAGFAAEGVFLIAAGLLGRLRFAWHTDGIGRAGLALLLYSLVIHPLVLVAMGRDWRGAELFLLAPDPTAIGTLGLLLTIPGRSHIALAILPLLWCLVSGATFWAMDSQAGMLVPAAAMVAAVPMVGRRLFR